MTTKLQWQLIALFVGLIAGYEVAGFQQRAEARPTIYMSDSGTLAENKSFFIVRDEIQRKCLIVIEVHSTNMRSMGVTSQPWGCN